MRTLGFLSGLLLPLLLSLAAVTLSTCRVPLPGTSAVRDDGGESPPQLEFPEEEPVDFVRMILDQFMIDEADLSLTAAELMDFLNGKAQVLGFDVTPLAAPVRQAVANLGIRQVTLRVKDGGGLLRVDLKAASFKQRAAFSGGTQIVSIADTITISRVESKLQRYIFQVTGFSLNGAPVQQVILDEEEGIIMVAANGAYGVFDPVKVLSFYDAHEADIERALANFKSGDSSNRAIVEGTARALNWANGLAYNHNYIRLKIDQGSEYTSKVKTRFLTFFAEEWAEKALSEVIAKAKTVEFLSTGRASRRASRLTMTLTGCVRGNISGANNGASEMQLGNCSNASPSIDIHGTHPTAFGIGGVWVTGCRRGPLGMHNWCGVGPIHFAQIRNSRGAVTLADGTRRESFGSIVFHGDVDASPQGSLLFGNVVASEAVSQTLWIMEPATP